MNALRDHDDFATLDAGIARTCAGDRDAFRVVIELTQPAVRVVVAAIVPVAALVDDVVQESYLTAYRHLADYRQGSDASAWMKGIARNCALNARRSWLRRRRATEAYGVELAQRLEAPLLAWSERVDDRLLDALTACVETLAPIAQAVVRAHYWQGDDAAAIGEAHGHEAGWGRVVLHRARGFGRMPATAGGEAVTHDRFEELCADSVAGTLSEAESAELLTVLSRDGQGEALAAQIAVDRSLHLLAQPLLPIDTIMRGLPQRAGVTGRIMRHIRGQARPLTTPARRLSWPRFAIAAAMAASVLIAVTLAMTAQTPPAFVLSSSTAMVQWQRAAEVQSLSPGHAVALIAGDRVLVPDGAQASLVASDGTRLECSAGMDLLIDADQPDAQRLRLAAGRCVAQVTPRPLTGSFTIVTPQAEVAVVGTRFTLSVSAIGTALAVTDGTVRWHAGEVERLVHAGETATSIPDPPVAVPPPISLMAVADADADADAPSASFGHAQTLCLRAGHAAGERVALLRFQLPETTASVRAELVLHRLSGSGQVEVLLQDDVGTWSEDDLRWHHLPTRGRSLGLMEAHAGTLLLSLNATLQGRRTVELLLRCTDGVTEVASREAGATGPALMLSSPAP